MGNSSTNKGSPHHYLLIDDNRVFAATLARTLENLGNQVAYCTEPDAALHINLQQRPERVILDMKLDGSSGLELIEPLKRDNPTLAIVLLTGYSSINTAVEAIKLGADHYLCKPAGVDEIIAAFDHQPGQVEPPANPPSVNRLEWEHIQRVLAAHDGNISATARALGMHRRTLQRKLQKKPVRE
ncbi:MAG TPA: two-component system response regulator [Gammaproteobacteria bacterium]|nr:two-component system response regulator [Gammaproteobacteria bacterium]